jgi:hypothetical protein
MKLEELIRNYVSPVKRFDQVLGNDYNAEDITAYYKNQVFPIRDSRQKFTRLRDSPE